MNSSFLFPINEDQYGQLPHYRNYGAVYKAIFNRLNERAGEQWKIIQTSDFAPYTETMLPEIIDSGKLPYEALSFLYEVMPSEKVQQENDKAFSLKKSEPIENQLLYFPEHTVAVANITTFVATGSNWPEHTVFAPSAEHVIAFIGTLNELQRQAMKHSITYLVDSEEGIEKRTYSASEKIEREDVLLSDHIKNELFRSIDEFFSNDGSFFKEYGLPYKRGVLLYGSPGNGKTTLVRSITGTTDAPVIYWQITEFTGSHSVQEVFSTAERLAPAILVIEDIDSMPEHMRSTFLNVLDGVHVRDGLFIIGTTNYPERIDPALINRAGRFDSTYEIAAPNAETRQQYMKKLDKKQLLNDGQIEEIAQKTKDLSISQLNELYMSIALTYHYEGIVLYDERINELQKQHKRSERNDWEDGSTIGF